MFVGLLPSRLKKKWLSALFACGQALKGAGLLCVRICQMHVSLCMSLDMHHNMCICIHKTEIRKFMYQCLCFMHWCAEVTEVWIDVCLTLLHCIVVRTWDWTAHPLKGIHLYILPSSSQQWITYPIKSVAGSDAQTQAHTHRWMHTHTNTHTHTNKDTHWILPLAVNVTERTHPFLIMCQTSLANSTVRRHVYDIYTVYASLHHDWSIFWGGLSNCHPWSPPFRVWHHNLWFSPAPVTTCTHSNTGPNKWWKVAWLQLTHAVRKIIIELRGKTRTYLNIEASRIEPAIPVCQLFL